MMMMMMMSGRAYYLSSKSYCHSFYTCEVITEEPRAAGVILSSVRVYIAHKKTAVDLVNIFGAENTITNGKA